MSYIRLPGMGTDPAADPVVEAPVLAEDVAKLAEAPFPEPETVGGSPATAKAPAPEKEHIDQVYEQVKASVGDALIEDIGYKMGAVYKDFSQQVKQDMIAQAAVDAAITTILMFIPVVGWIIAIIYAAVRSLLGGRFNNQAMAIVADAQREAQLLEAAWNARLQVLQKQTIEEETPKAIKLATVLALGDTLPKAPAVQGLGNIAAILIAAAAAKKAKEKAPAAAPTPEQEAEKKRQLATATAIMFALNPAAQAAFSQGLRKLVDPKGYEESKKSHTEKAVDRGSAAIKKYGYTVLTSVVNPVITVGAAVKSGGDLHKVPTVVDHEVDRMSGHIIVTRAKQVATETLNFTNQKLLLQYNATKKQMEAPDYRAHLRLQIAQAILQNPEIQKIFAGIILARQNADRPLKIEQVPAVAQSNLPAKPNTTLLVGGGIAAAIAAWFMTR